MTESGFTRPRKKIREKRGKEQKGKKPRKRRPEAKEGGRLPEKVRIGSTADAGVVSRSTRESALGGLRVMVYFRCTVPNHGNRQVTLLGLEIECQKGILRGSFNTVERSLPKAEFLAH